MRLYRLFLCVILLALANNVLISQTIKILRSDVDSSRGNFVTAGYLFTLDIAIEGLDKVSSASFDLSWTYAQYIHFSDAIHTQFGRGGKKPVVIHRTDTAADVGNLFVGVIAADTLGGPGYNNPVIIQLQFAVSPNIQDSIVTTFSFNRPQAVVTSGKIGDLIKPLESEPRNFTIHGYVPIWPGDADNDGEVTSMDVTQIGRYIGYGSTNNFQMRSFKRRNASTIWYPQYCLAWDSLNVTFADCDGNADVTVTDQLIVAINFYKTHFGNTNTTPVARANSEEENINLADYSSLKRKDVYINSIVPFYSAAGTIRWTSADGTSKVVGVESGDIFRDSYFYRKIDSENHILHISNLQFAMSRQYKNMGKFCKLIIDGNPDNIILSQDISAVSNTNDIFKISANSDINQYNDENSYTIEFRDNLLTIYDCAENPNIAYIYNVAGELIDTYSFNEKLTKRLNLPSGMYIVKVGDTDKKILICD